MVNYSTYIVVFTAKTIGIYHSDIINYFVPHILISILSYMTKIEWNASIFRNNIFRSFILFVISILIIKLLMTFEGIQFFS